MNKHITAKIDATRADEESRTVPVSLSSETPVPRADYIEILDHSPGAVDLSRSPLPVLVQHNRHEINVGIIEHIKIVARKLRGLLRLGESDEATALWKDIQGGIIRNLSVGYQFEWDNVTENDGVARVMHWQPVEVSIVSVPADPNVGINRNMETNMSEENENTKTLTRSQKKSAQRESGARDERDRVKGLLSFGRSSDNMMLAERFIKNGRSVQDLQDCVDAVESQAPSIPSQPVRDLNIDPRHYTGEQHSLLRAIASQIPGVQVDGGYEIETSQELSRSLGKKPQGIYVPMGGGQRAAISTVGDGGSLVGVNHMSGEFVDVLRNASIIMGLGARVFNQQHGDLSIPRQTGGSNTFWVAEGDDVGEGGPTFDNITMSPQTVGVYQDLTRKMILQGSPDAQQMLISDLAQSVALEIDRVAISGSGVSPQPAGIRNVSGVGLVSLGANGAAITWNSIVDLIGSLGNANADSGNLGFATNSKVRSSLMKTEKFAGSNGEAIWSSGNRGEGTIAGYPVGISNHVPSNITKGSGSNLSSLVFGNWSDILIGHWGILDVLVDPYTLGLSGGIRVRAMMDVDVAVRHPESFAIIEDAVA